MTNPDQLTLSISRLVEDLASRVRLYDVSVAGIEVTQSIQYYDAEGHLTDPADRGADNSVTLAAYKAAYVRVYLRSGLLAASIPNLTGSLVVERRRSNGLSFVFQPVATYSPIAPGTVTAEQDPAYTTERGALGSSLNFIIPASECYGSLRLTAHIQGHPNATKTIVVAARLVQTLRVRAILVHYNGPSTANPAPGTAAPTIDLPEPTLAELQTTASTALAMMPVQATGSFAVSGHMNWFEPLDDARSGAGACSINWNSFLVWLGLMRDADGNRGDVVYFGLLPTGMPLNVPGCGQSGIGAGAVGDGATMVHEMGHGYGFAHTPCGAAGATDANYPTYEPYASASIGEFGLDIRTGAVLDPASARDYMSYCFPQWMSLYQHDRLIDHPRLAPYWLTDRIRIPIPVLFDPTKRWWPDPPWEDEGPEAHMNPVISILGEVALDGTVTVHSIARILAAGAPEGPVLTWAAQLVGESGAVLAEARVHRIDLHGGCGCGDDGDPQRPPFAFHAYIPDVALGDSLRLRVGTEEVWSRSRRGDPPRFTAVTAEAGDDRLVLDWRVEADADAEPDVWAQWRSRSEKQDARWHGLSVRLAKGSAAIPLSGLPAGPVEVRLLAHDGFSTGTSEPVVVEIPEQAPVVVILHPTEGQRLSPGLPVQAVGNGTTSDGYPLDGRTLTWQLDGRAVGEDREVWLDPLEPGEHELTLLVASHDAEERRTVRFQVDEREEDLR